MSVSMCVCRRQPHIMVGLQLHGHQEGGGFDVCVPVCGVAAEESRAQGSRSRRAFAGACVVGAREAGGSLLGMWALAPACCISRWASCPRDPVSCFSLTSRPQLNSLFGVEKCHAAEGESCLFYQEIQNIVRAITCICEKAPCHFQYFLF